MYLTHTFHTVVINLLQYIRRERGGNQTAGCAGAAADGLKCGASGKFAGDLQGRGPGGHGRDRRGHPAGRRL